MTAQRKPDGFDLMLAAHSPDASVRAAAEKMLRRGRKKSAPRKPSAAPVVDATPRPPVRRGKCSRCGLTLVCARWCWEKPYRPRKAPAGREAARR